MSHQSISYLPEQLRFEFGEKEDQYYFTSQLLQGSPEGTTISSLPSYLTDKVIVIDSIHSGIGRNKEKDIYDKIFFPLFEALSITHDIIKTESSTTIRDYASSLLNDSNESITIIFISGDSSINEFINGLKDTKIPGKISIFAIPGGTGNSLSLSLNITNAIDSIVKLFQSTPLPLYLYQAEFPKHSYYLNQNEIEELENSTDVKFLIVLSWAFHASLVADSDTPELRTHGLQRFQIAATQNLNRIQKYEGDMYINNDHDEQCIKGPFAYWLLVSSLRFEPTFEISPNGDISKDELYLVAFNSKDDDKDHIMNIMKQVYDNGKHINNPDVIYKKIGPDDKIILKVKNSKPLIQRRFCVDGRIVALPETDDDQEIKINVKDNTQYSWKLYIIH